MKIKISEKASAWYKEEMYVTEGDHIRFFARYGGFSTVHPGYSLGMSKDEPFDLGIETIIDGVHFFIEEKDLWYFDGHDLLVDVNPKIGEPEYIIA
ncbi:HesB/YadR/YfhF family protein [Bacillus dakarensis]|uniref:HesB/YadR/YfhF family protein n=1 Tax=Robertmurraya dakarensis TaxID=1926278 RepID=UPI000981C4B7|nr:HesB/YadR/YfhF family protein [Bacillus dakarensis]